jgi:hypothetical protein
LGDYGAPSFVLDPNNFRTQHSIRFSTATRPVKSGAMPVSETAGPKSPNSI